MFMTMQRRNIFLLTALLFYCCCLLCHGEAEGEAVDLSKEAPSPVLAADPDEEEHMRTATGGAIHSLIVMLTVFAFLGNGAFLVYVFWIAK